MLKEEWNERWDSRFYDPCHLTWSNPPHFEVMKLMDQKYHCCCCWFLPFFPCYCCCSNCSLSQSPRQLVRAATYSIRRVEDRQVHSSTFPSLSLFGRRPKVWLWRKVLKESVYRLPTGTSFFTAFKTSAFSLLFSGVVKGTPDSGAIMVMTRIVWIQRRRSGVHGIIQIWSDHMSCLKWESSKVGEFDEMVKWQWTNENRRLSHTTWIAAVLSSSSILTDAVPL